MENAIRETKRDILPMYGKDTRIIKEYDRMVVRLNMNCTAAQVLEEFSERVRQEDVGDFVNVFAAAKISGGDSVAIIRNAVPRSLGIIFPKYCLILTVSAFMTVT